jgi:hypothetical protein
VGSLCVTIVGQLIRFCRVQATKRISHHCLLDNHVISGNLRGLLECSTQAARDAKKVYDNTIQVSIGYTSSMGTSLWTKIRDDRDLVGPGYGIVVVDWLTWF